jgi:hypothetical protein
MERTVGKSEMRVWWKRQIPHSSRCPEDEDGIDQRRSGLPAAPDRVGIWDAGERADRGLRNKCYTDRSLQNKVWAHVSCWTLPLDRRSIEDHLYNCLSTMYCLPTSLYTLSR